MANYDCEEPTFEYFSKTKNMKCTSMGCPTHDPQKDVPCNKCNTIVVHYCRVNKKETTYKLKCLQCCSKKECKD